MNAKVENKPSVKIDRVLVPQENTKSVICCTDTKSQGLVVSSHRTQINIVPTESIRGLKLFVMRISTN